MAIELREVRGLADLKKFIKFPFTLYKDDPYWIPPLIKGELDVLRPEKNPTLDHCEWRYLLAYKDGKLAGRIAGIINHRFIERWEKKWARFCWFDFIDDREVSSALLGAIEKWAVEKGMGKILGPQGFTTFERQGIVIKGFDHLPAMGSTYNFEYYAGHLEALGYGKEADYVEYEVKVPDEIPEKATKLRDLILKRYNLRTLENMTLKKILPYADQVFQIINRAYEPLFGFVELTEKQIKYFTRKYFTFLEPEYITGVVDENDKMVGFQISIPSMAKAFQKARGKLFPFGFMHFKRALKNNNRLDIMLVAVDPDYHNKGVNAIFMTDMTKIAIDKGIEFAESNGELEENEKVQNFWRYYDTNQYKRLRVFARELVST